MEVGVPESLRRCKDLVKLHQFSLSAVGLLEVKVKHYLGRSWSLLGFPLEQVCHQMDGFRTGIWDQCLQITGNTLRPTEIHSICQLVALRPIILEGEESPSYTTCLHIITLQKVHD